MASVADLVAGLSAVAATVREAASMLDRSRDSWRQAAAGYAEVLAGSQDPTADVPEKPGAPSLDQVVARERNRVGRTPDGAKAFGALIRENGIADQPPTPFRCDKQLGTVIRKLWPPGSTLTVVDPTGREWTYPKDVPR